MTQDQREILFPEIGAGEGLSWSWHLDLETLLAALSEPAPWNRCPPSPVPHPSGPAVRPGSDLIGPNLKMAGPSLDLAGRGPGRDLAGPGPDLAGPAESADREPVGTTPTTASVDPAEADFAEYLDAVDAGRSSVVPLSVAAGRVAEVLPTSPDLAAWLACNPAGNWRTVRWRARLPGTGGWPRGRRPGNWPSSRRWHHGPPPPTRPPK